MFSMHVCAVCMLCMYVVYVRPYVMLCCVCKLGYECNDMYCLFVRALCPVCMFLYLRYVCALRVYVRRVCCVYMYVVCVWCVLMLCMYDMHVVYVGMFVCSVAVHVWYVLYVCYLVVVW